MELRCEGNFLKNRNNFEKLQSLHNKKRATKIYTVSTIIISRLGSPVIDDGLIFFYEPDREWSTPVQVKSRDLTVNGKKIIADLAH